ncbi:MAG: substrate-binding domain-containing protein, partial [Floccifex sp.]
FVFFVNQNNPIDTLTSNQIKSIYHGDITNWEEIGGKRHEIIAFQRPERSGSQAMMNYFMGDVSLKEPLTYEMQGGMGEIIHEVAQYHNEDGAIGYTFKYFLEGLNQEENVKILSIDGIYPTNENIKNQSYPISTYLYCVTLKDNSNPNVQKLKDYLLSQQGQYIIEETGYCSLY